MDSEKKIVSYISDFYDGVFEETSPLFFLSFTKKNISNAEKIDIIRRRLPSILEEISPYKIRLSSNLNTSRTKKCKKIVNILFETFEGSISSVMKESFYLKLDFVAKECFSITKTDHPECIRSLEILREVFLTVGDYPSILEVEEEILKATVLKEPGSFL